MHLVALVLEFIRTNPAAVAVIIGSVTPLVISVIQQPKLVKWQRTAIAIGSSALLGGATAYATGMFDSARDLLTIVVILYSASETFYQKLWSKVGLTQKIEQATSPSPKPDVIEGELVDQGE